MAVASGEIGAYRWIECLQPQEVTLEIMRPVMPLLTGLRAVNVSWDSGLLVPSGDDELGGWTLQQGHAVSPPIDGKAIQQWPFCDGGFEEWYFFEALPSDIRISAYCNWTGLSLADWASLKDVPSGFDLQSQLERAQPRLVLGTGTAVFAITSDPVLLTAIGGLIKSGTHPEPSTLEFPP